MPKNQRKNPAAGKAAAKSTVSGPRKGPRKDSDDPAVRKMQGTQDLAAAFPFNANKPAEFGEPAREPEQGASAKPSDPSVTGSTLTEGPASTCCWGPTG